ncbi:molybdate ABC transporter substrate-binding protein [Desulfurococcaceae archaeon MEX13E-LK6-19]|nr:molybdate ABC transporter substrate-binding protein [Desulfurococcaceae archaeon MEX13E-LK6-19]
MKYTVIIIGVFIIGVIVGFALSNVINSLAREEERPVLKFFAGAAAEKPWREIIEEFEKETGIKVEAYFSGSGKVLTVLEITKDGDIFAPGSPDYMIKAIEDGVVDPNTVKIVAYLVPAIIVPKGNPKNITSLEDLAKPGVRIGIGDPETVCVGEYAVDLLKYNGLYDVVKDNIVVYAESCSKTAMLPATGAVDAIIGWHVFHYWYPDKTEIIWLKPEQIPKISYIPIGVTKFCKNIDLALKFIEFVTTSEFAKEVFRKYHYFATIEEAREYAPYAEVPEINATSG